MNYRLVLSPDEYEGLTALAAAQGVEPPEALRQLLAQEAARPDSVMVRAVLDKIDGAVRELGEDVRAMLASMVVDFAVRYDRMRPKPIPPPPARTGGPAVSVSLSEEEEAQVRAILPDLSPRTALVRILANVLDRTHPDARSAVGVCRAALQRHEAWMQGQIAAFAKDMGEEVRKLDVVRGLVDELERALGET